MGNKTIKHTRSAGGIVVNKKGQILVVKQEGSGTTWSLPKGHIKEKEDELEGAKREIYEESGIKNLEFVKSLGSYQRRSLGKDTPELKTVIMFLFKTTESRVKPIDPENPEAKWVEKNCVVDLLTHPKDKEFFLRILKGI